MVDMEIVAPYAGARVTRLVNRHDILEQIRQAVSDPSCETHVFYLEANGGMGKTFLSREVLRLCGKKGEWATPDLIAAEHEVDFYHHQARSIDGFMAAFAEALAPGPGFFTEYRHEYRQLQKAKADMYSALNDLLEAPERVKASFLKGCEELTAQKRVVVALDTVERLSYETDHIQQKLELGQEAMGVRPWMLEQWLPRMKNAVILVSGRPRKRPHETFKEDLEQAVGLCAAHYWMPEMRAFGLQETAEYLQAVRETAKRDRNTRAVRRLDAISDDSRRMIYALTGGQPITLALIIDYYLASDWLLPDIKKSIDEVADLSDDELAELAADPDEQLKARQERVKGEVVRLFRETRREANDAIVNLAWAPMGMDAELLRRVASLTLDEASRILDTLANPRSGLSFVKVRRPDNRVFLHDEMYTLMQRHVLDHLPERKKKVDDIILEYYKEKIKAQEEKVRELQTRRPGSWLSSGPPRARRRQRDNSQELAAALAGLDALRVEEVFYRLRKDPLDGFTQYCEYAQAAVTSRNDSLDMQLRDQMLSFVRDAFGKEQELGGLRRGAVERDSALRWGWRAVYASDLEEARKLANHLRQHERGFLKEGGALAKAELDTIDGWSEAFLGTDLDQAEKRLRGAVNAMRQFRPQSKLEYLRRTILLAQAYHVLGYLMRVQGRFQVACEIYRNALPLWRELKREPDHAETLNNLGWAYAEAGNFRRALRCTRDALHMREELGHRYSIALGYNTLGLVEVKADQPHRGIIHCERALDLFRNLGTTRGIGLALTALAEAHRRRADLPDLYPVHERVQWLKDAASYAGQAVDIFQTKVTEPLRLVEALNEAGCVYRNWARLWPEHHVEGDPSQEELFEKGEAALSEAARRAGKTFDYRRVDALVNLAWLHFYVGHQDKEAIDTLLLTEQDIPSQYRIVEGKGVPQVENPASFLWVQLSKISNLLGEIAMKEYWGVPSPGARQVRDPARLREAAEHYTLSLAYGELFADDYRDIRRAKDGIYDQFRRANVEEIQTVYQAVRQTALKYDLEYRPAGYRLPARPRMRHFMEENFGTLAELERGPAWLSI
ncbi:MAG: tetratricopeptide repeat protein [Anaerolineae bacterium]|nr:tetratricopeptide repeat protein [Anaerolineae bacterium]